MQSYTYQLQNLRIWLRVTVAREENGRILAKTIEWLWWGHRLGRVNGKLLGAFVSFLFFGFHKFSVFRVHYSCGLKQSC